MCGIVGFINANDKYDFNLGKSISGAMYDLLFVDTVRGHHGTGVAKIGANITIKKAMKPAWEFLAEQENLNFIRNIDNAPFVIGHNRYATRGDKTKDINAHPFQEGPITLVHNGTLNFQGQLPGYVYNKYDVDSNAIAGALAHVNEDEVDQVSSALNGSFSLVWHDSRNDKLHFLRNKERPMYWLYTKQNVMFYGSELAMLKWVATRWGFTQIEKDGALTTEPYKLYTFEPGSLEFEVREVPRYAPKQYTTVSRVFPIGPGHGNITNRHDDEYYYRKYRNARGNEVPLYELVALGERFNIGDEVDFSLVDYTPIKGRKFISIEGKIIDDYKNADKVVVRGNFSGTEEELYTSEFLMKGVVTSVTSSMKTGQVLLYLRDITFADNIDPDWAKAKQLSQDILEKNKKDNQEKKPVAVEEKNETTAATQNKGSVVPFKRADTPIISSLQKPQMSGSCHACFGQGTLYKVDDANIRGVVRTGLLCGICFSQYVGSPDVALPKNIYH